RLTELEKVRAAQASLSDENIGKLSERLAGIEEQNVMAEKAREQIRTEGRTTTDALADRLGTVEQQNAEVARAIDQNRNAAGILADRTAALERISIEFQQAQAQLNSDTAALSEGLKSMDERVREQSVLSTEQMAQMAKRLEAVAIQLADLESATAAEARQMLAVRATTDDRLNVLESREAQVSRLTELTDQLTLLGEQVTERVDAQASDFERLATRLETAEAGLQSFQEAPPGWGEALDRKVRYVADELTPRVDEQAKELEAVAKGLEAVRDNPEVLQLSDRINTLGTNMVQRLDDIETRVETVETDSRAVGKAAEQRYSDMTRQLEILGKTVPESVDTLARAADMLRLRFKDLGERIVLLEKIQKAESTELRQRFNDLSKALSELNAGQ
ncbi:MAG: hypothetical protein ACE5FN_08270, partial [Leptospirillia bacterium]